MSGKSGAPPSGQQNYSPYPVQPRVAAYPTQAYPQQQYAYPSAPMQQQAYVQQGPPPAYSAVPPQHHQQGPPPAYTQQYTQAPPAAVYLPPPQGSPVNLQFDSGARFDGASQPRIPPPPPGCMPTAAQVSALQGHPVNVSQRRGDIWTGGEGGGVSFGF